ncbi:MAG: NAD(P)-dependent oxidoreductase [Flavobacteriales bacterium]
MLLHVLVSGGGRFIGGRLCERVVRAGHRVTLLDDVDPASDPVLAPLAGHPAFWAVRGDARDPHALTAAFATGPVTAIAHLAAPAEGAGPLEVHAAQVRGTLAVLEAARAHGVEHVLLHGGMDERPGSHAQVARSAARRFAEVHAMLHRSRITWIKAHEVYGPGQSAGGVVARTAAALRHGRPELSDGPFHLVHVNELADHILALLYADGPSRFTVDAGPVGSMMRSEDLVRSVQAAMKAWQRAAEAATPGEGSYVDGSIFAHELSRI